MPKNSIQITAFNGMLGVVEERDLPPGAAVYAKNLNMITQEGAFTPLPNDLSTAYAISGGTAGGKLFIPFSDGTRAVYHSGTALVVVGNLDTTPATLTLTDDYTLSETITSGDHSGVSDGEAVHFGLGGATGKIPIWVGKPQYGQFGGAAPTNYVKTFATPAWQPLGDQSATNVTETMTSTQSEVIYRNLSYIGYFASLTYDGYQEGPLVNVGVGSVVTTGTEVGCKKVDVVVRVILTGGTGLENLSKRVSGLNVYRQVSEFEAAGVDEYGSTIWVGLKSDMELVKSVDINDAGWSDENWSTYTGKKITIADEGYVSRSYEDRTGMSPIWEMRDWGVHYGLSVAADSYHIVGDVWHDKLGYKPNMLLRSKYGRYDTFDWANDYLVLPTTPVALAHFAGRTYAFSRGRTHIIDPNALRVEETWEGIGGLAAKAVCVSDRGMFWADENNIYWHDGSRVRPIANPVMTNRWLAAAGWANSTVSTSNTPTLTYSAKYDSLIVMYTASGTSYGLMFHLGSGRWVHLTLAENGVLGGAFIGPGGEPFYAVNGTLYEFAGAGTNRTWQWISHNVVQDTGMDHIFYHAVASWDGSAPGLEYYDGDPNYGVAHAWSNTSSEGGNMTRGQINQRSGGGWDRVKDFALRIDGSATQTVNDITLIYRQVTPR